ncbi:dynein axonemal assembly factor 19 [Menidia menidia]
MERRDVIDFSALEKELRAATESDRKYERENRAKLRAASQGVPYDQFRDLVLTAHLKPLDRKDKEGGPRKQPWNPVAPPPPPPPPEPRPPHRSPAPPPEPRVR